MKPAALLEPMDMPEPNFPVKVHRCKADEYGTTLFTNHWHKHIELLYFISGKAVINCNSETIHVQPGDLVFVNSNDLHAGVSLSNNLFYYALIFDPAVLQSHTIDAVETKYMLPIIRNLILFRNRIEQPGDVADDLMAIVRELDGRDEGYELSIKAHLYRLLVRLVRSGAAQDQPTKDQRVRMRQLEQFTPVLAYIEDHYHEELSIELLAAKVGLSRFHFSRRFKMLTDKCVTEYMTDIRIRHAEYLLYNTQHTISEIALSVGFRDIYYFSRMFKKYRNIPPSHIRNQN